MLAPNIPVFKQALINLWKSPVPTSTIFQTGDLIQTLWQNAVVTGYPTPCVVPPNSTYAGFAPLAPGKIGTEQIAASAFEAACSQMVLSTLFIIVPPPFVTPPPIPGGTSLPGALTATLLPIFLAGTAATAYYQNANQIADAITNYLQSWTILVTIPPGAAIPVPII